PRRPSAACARPRARGGQLGPGQWQEATRLLPRNPGVRRPRMLEHLTLAEFVVALLMGLAALSAFVWAAVSGAFRDVEAIKYRVLDVEADEDHERQRA